MSFLVAAATLAILVEGLPIAPDLITEPGIATVMVEAEGHPNEISIDAIPPVGALFNVTTCGATPECSGPVNLDQFGLWRIVVSIAHQHGAVDGGPYVWVGGAAVTVFDQSSIFADGFETGTTAEWSKTIGGE